jgi:hypothetical protein
MVRAMKSLMGMDKPHSTRTGPKMPMLEPFVFFWQRVEDNAFHLGMLGGSASPKTMPKLSPKAQAPCALA